MIDSLIRVGSQLFVYWILLIVHSMIVMEYHSMDIPLCSKNGDRIGVLSPTLSIFRGNIHLK